MKNIPIDRLSLYRGKSFEICDNITIRVPTLNEICSYGESKYFSMVHALCSVGIDLCWQLDEMGIPFDEISDYTLFCQLLSRQFTVKDTKILFGDNLDFSKMKLYTLENNNIILVQNQDSDINHNIEIDENSYFKIVTYLREIHNLKRDNRIAGTNSCRRAFIEDAKMEYEAQKTEKPKSVLLAMISTMVNIEGFKRDDTTIWDMNIYAFMDSIKRVSKIRNSTLLLQSGYSGFGIDLNKMKNKDELDYMGELS